MKEIREYWFDRLCSDTTLRGLTGYTASDRRIFLEWPPEVIALGITYPAYMTYNLMKPSPLNPLAEVEVTQQLDIVIEMNVWAISPDVRDDIGERITVLFKDLSFTTTSYIGLAVKKESEEDITELQRGTGQIDSYRKYLRFRIEHVFAL